MICRISALISDDIMIKKKQTAFEKLSDDDVKKYKWVRYIFIWKQWYQFLRLAWSENKKSDIINIRNLYQKTIMINNYIIRSS